jgi:hypothetical protein
MKLIIRLIVTVLLVAGWGLALASLHIIRTPSNVWLLPKDSIDFNPFRVYVDTRAWTGADLVANQQVVKRIVSSGKAEMLRHVVNAPEGANIEELLAEEMLKAGKKSDDKAGGGDLRAGAEQLWKQLRW